MHGWFFICFKWDLRLLACVIIVFFDIMFLTLILLE
jgi:hypothetical protein